MGSLSDVWSPSRRRLATLALVEFVVLVAAIYAAASLRFLGNFADISWQLGALLPRALLFALVMSMAQAALGQYQTHSRERLRGQVLRSIVAFIFGGVFLVLAYYAFPPSHMGRGVLALALVIGFVAIILVRALFERMVHPDMLKRRVLVVGAGRKAALVLDRMRRDADRRGFNLVGFLPIPGDEVIVPERYCLETNVPLIRRIVDLDVHEIVVGPDDRRGTLPMDDLLACRLGGVNVVDLVTFFERESGKVKLNLVNPSWLIFSAGFDRGSWRTRTKRAFDLLVSLLALVLATPLMLLTALAIVLESGFAAPILYRQERVGEGGEPFMVLKFRSMRTDAEQDGVARWASANDDRVTRVGRVIRKIRFDELPQIFNVLAGEMSFVGPRPERPTIVADLGEHIPYYGLRHCVKPGISGWAQLRYPYGASVQDAAEKLKFDLYYVKNHSLLFDIMVLLQTVEVVLFGKGAR